MTSKFLTRNGEVYRVLHQNEDTYWMISFDDPVKSPFCIAITELENFQRIQAPQDFVTDDCNLSSAAQKRLALIQPLLLLREKIGKRGVEEEIGNRVRLMLQFSHERVHLMRDIYRGIRQLT